MKRIEEWDNRIGWERWNDGAAVSLTAKPHRCFLTGYRLKSNEPRIKFAMTKISIEGIDASDNFVPTIFRAGSIKYARRHRTQMIVVYMKKIIIVSPSATVNGGEAHATPSSWMRECARISKGTPEN